MDRTPLLAVALLLLVAAASGCTSGERDTAAGGEPRLGEGPSEVWAGNGTSQAPGVIEGVVSDVLFNPLQGVRVAVEGEQLSAATDLTGSFRLEGLEVGVYTLAVSKEGFAPAMRKVNVVSTQPSRVEVQLTPLPKGDPFDDRFDWRGFVECAHSVTPDPTGGGFNPVSCVPEHVVDLNSDGVTNQRDRFLFPVNEGARTIVAELAWEKPTPASPNSMRYEVQTNGSAPRTVKAYEGPTPARIEIGGLLLPEAPTFLQVHFTPPTNEPAVVAQQAFDVYVTVFYVDEAPYAWSRLSEGQ